MDVREIPAVEIGVAGSETVMGSLTQLMGDGETMNLYYNATEGWW